LARKGSVWSRVPPQRKSYAVPDIPTQSGGSGCRRTSHPNEARRGADALVTRSDPSVKPTFTPRRPRGGTRDEARVDEERDEAHTRRRQRQPPATPRRPRGGTRGEARATKSETRLTRGGDRDSRPPATPPMRANEARLEQTKRARRGSLEEQQAPLHGRSKCRSAALDRDLPEQHDSRAYRRRVQRERRSTPRDVMQQQHQEWAVGPPPLAARWTRPSWQS
jgi:hypothetical protein